MGDKPKKIEVKEPVIRPFTPFLKRAMERADETGPSGPKSNAGLPTAAAPLAKPDDELRQGEIDMIDYSRVAFRSFLPPCRKGKFIQVTDDEARYMALAPYELATHHAVILERFCMQHEVKGIWVRKPSVFRILDGEWEILGGGHFVIDDEERSLRLFGESTSYGGFDRVGLKGKLATVPALQGYSIRIG